MVLSQESGYPWGTVFGGGAQRRFYYSGSILFLHPGAGYTLVCENSTSCTFIFALT